MFEKVKFKGSVNKSMALLGVPPTIFKSEFRCNLQDVGWSSKFTPEETAIYGASKVSIGMLELDFETVAFARILEWMVDGKVRPQALDMMAASSTTFQYSVVGRVIDQVKDTLSEKSDE